MRYVFLTIAVMLSLAAIPAQGQVQYNQGYYNQAQATPLSPKDQQNFDKYYHKWLDATRKGDQDDIQGNAQHMQDIMAKYNIPANTPYAQIADNAGAYGYANPNAAYPGAAYPNSAYGQRLAPGDQQKFDTYYQKWVDAVRKNDSDDIQGNARHMQDIMAKYNIPPNTPFQAVASNGAAVGYPAPNPAYSYAGVPAQRLSAKDQKDFDKDYKNWVDARRKRDMDDVDKNAKKMENIMARYNIPANVPFDQIATQGAAYR